MSGAEAAIERLAIKAERIAHAHAETLARKRAAAGRLRVLSNDDN